MLNINGIILYASTMTILSTLVKPATTLAEREAKKTLHGGQLPRLQDGALHSPIFVFCVQKKTPLYVAPANNFKD